MAMTASALRAKMNLTLNPSGRRDFSRAIFNESDSDDELVEIVKKVYDDPQTFRYHVQVWGDALHVGRYDLLDGGDAELKGRARVERAAALTTEVLITKLSDSALFPGNITTVMDMGSAFGSTARALVNKIGCNVVCIDISSKLNAANAARTVEMGLAEKVIIPGERSFCNTGIPSASMDGVVSMDSFAHANGNTDGIMKEAARVLNRGGVMVFTDVMKSEMADPFALAEAYEKLEVLAYASPEEYERSGWHHGMELVEFDDQTRNLTNHYRILVGVMTTQRGTFDGVDDSVLDAKIARCNVLADGGEHGLLRWGLLKFKKKMASGKITRLHQIVLMHYHPFFYGPNIGAKVSTRGSPPPQYTDV